ncbi:hypothetical protein [Martelella soudanensis]|uniref:hypothetical protein n=1 Tax=unclassified Martelella TaxID=2629616 RepID=UPI0015DEB0E0|nr:MULTISPECIES: hypothetical protein [unclassified Martelella]
MAEPFTNIQKPAKIAVIGGMMAYFETIMPKGFRDDLGRHVGAATAALGDEFMLDELGLWADDGDTARMAQRLRANPPEALLLVPTMATPPAAIAALAREAGVPVVIACTHDLSEITDAYDMRALCRHSTNVGATMLGAMLARVPDAPGHVVIAGFLDDAEFHRRLAMALRVAVLARRMKGLRIGRFGPVMPGYDHVGLNEEEAAMGGVEVIDIALDDWASCHAAVTVEEIAAFRGDRLPALLPEGTEWSASEDLERAIRMAIALDRMACERDIACGSLTCRGPFGVELPNGSIGCLATTLMTGSGRPFSATGDLVTAVAMHIGKYLGGATLYCELDAVDRKRDAFLVANTGEGDFAFVPAGGAATIRPAAAHSGRDLPGVVLAHDLSMGPATMLGVVPDKGAGKFRLLALEGDTLSPARTALQVTHGWFRTNRRPALDAFEAWANAHATHHGALSRGHLGEAIGWLGRLTGYAVTEIASGRSPHG